MITIDVDIHGPIFNASTVNRVIHSYLEDAREDIAKDGVNKIRAELSHVIRHPTGRYESSIQTDRSFGSTLINDGGIIYGPWLEGVGSRNKTTRFKGYFTFRRTVQKIQNSAVPIAERRLPRVIARLNA